MARTGAPVVTGLTEVTEGAAVAVEIVHADTGVVIAVAAVEAGKGTVGAAKREVTAQNTWMIITEDRATIRNAAARDEAEALMAITRHPNMQPTPLII